MAHTADLLTVLHDIDTHRGKICASCYYWQKRGTDPNGERIGHCTNNYRPYGPDDGCDDWLSSCPDRAINPIDCGGDLK